MTLLKWHYSCKVHATGHDWWLVFFSWQRVLLLVVASFGHVRNRQKSMDRFTRMWVVDGGG